MFKVVTSNEVTLWHRELKNMISYDFYHTLEYFLLDDSGEAIMVIYRNQDVKIIFPFLIRKINGTKLFDATSPYGYVGPLSNTTEIPETCIFEFQMLLQEYFMKRNIICAFSRLHPLFNIQHTILKSYGDIVKLNKTVTIDLKQSIEKQRSNYGKSLKNRINKIKKYGVDITYSKSKHDLGKFIDIYYETMARTQARKEYYYSEDYFNKMLFSECYDSFILFAKYENQVIAGSLFTICSDIMQYHLSGTKDSSIHLSPMKLIIDEARIHGTKRKLSYFHLGGGVGGKDDKLFEFKKAFSNTTNVFSVWTNIIDKQKYEDIVQQKYGDNIPDVNYFPLYRYL